MDGYIEMQANNIDSDDLHAAVMKLTMHQQLVLKQGRWQEIMRILRVPSGWIYEIPSVNIFSKRTATFVPYP